MKVALDLGGTNIRAAIVEGDRVERQVSVACQAYADEGVVIEQIFSLIEPLMSPQVDGIGVGVPSVVDPVRGIVYNAANIPSWQEVHLKEKLEGRFNVPVKVNNDCNCFVLGEQAYGAARGLQNVVGITLGTGVGAGLVLNGRLYSGEFCGAGEVGSLPYRDSDYEHFCSTLWLKGRHGVTGAELAARAEAGDQAALNLWREFGQHLGELCKAILFAYAPQAIVIGGGIAPAIKYFRSGLDESLAAFPYRALADQCRILSAQLPHPNLLGAALL